MFISIWSKIKDYNLIQATLKMGVSKPNKVIDEESEQNINSRSTIEVILTSSDKVLVFCCKGNCNKDVKLLGFS